MKTPMRLGVTTMLGAALFLGVGACSSTTEPTNPTLTTTTGSTTEAPQAVETITLSEHGIIVGNPDAPKKIQIAIDQQCPSCRSFSEETDAKLTEAINSGDVQVEYFVMNFLNERGFGGWSTTAGNALNVVAMSDDSARWKDVYMELYKSQPLEENEVISIEEVIKSIQNAGVKLTDEERKQIEENAYADKVSKDTDYAFGIGVEGSPTILIDDVPQPALSDPEVFMEYLNTGEIPEATISTS